MWPFRKKPDPEPYRWWVKERLERQVVEAMQREAWREAGPLIAANMAAMQNAAHAHHQALGASLASQHGWIRLGSGIGSGFFRR